MSYKAVLFDMDGTVLDTLTDLCDSVNYALEKFGYPPITKAQCAANLGNGARVLLQKSAPEGADIDELLKVYLPYYNEHCLVKTAPYAGIPELMKTLRNRGVKMAIISNKPDTATQELSGQFFGNLVDYAVGESERVKRKPNPDAILAAARQFGLDVADCVYIGDTEVDLEAAKNAGMDVIAVLWGFRNRDELTRAGAGTFAASPEELLERLT